MNWEKFFYLLIIIAIGYLPYKLLQKQNKRGLSDISSITSWFLAVLFCLLTITLILQSPLTISSSNWVWGFFLFTVSVWFFMPKLIRIFGMYPAKMVIEKPKWFVARFEPHTFYLKFTEVIFQQIKFLFMLTVVLVEMDVEQKIIWFTLIIGFFHLNNLFFLPKKEALIFFILSFPMGILFGYLILQGYILLTISIHLWFYIFFAGYPWLRKL